MTTTKSKAQNTIDAANAASMQSSSQSAVRRTMVFLEDYDLEGFLEKTQSPRLQFAEFPNGTPCFKWGEKLDKVGIISPKGRPERDKAIVTLMKPIGTDDSEAFYMLHAGTMVKDFKDTDSWEL